MTDNVSEALALALVAHLEEFAEPNRVKRNSLEDLGDLIPEAVWSRLVDRKFVSMQRDISGESVTFLTNDGIRALAEHLRDLA